MAITVTTDMKYTRAGEAESNVLSAHDPLIWEWQESDGSVDGATIQFIAFDNLNAVIYTSAVFSAYLYDDSGPILFRFDATQIIKHIINNYFYKGTSEIIEPENYGSWVKVYIKTYDDTSLKDTELLEYFASHAVNQIGDEYGSNIPRMFLNDTEEIAHFLGYPTKIFFYMATDQSAHSPLIEIIDRDITESANLISGWTKLLYDTFDTTGTTVNEAIELGVNGTARSDAFTIELGKSYLILVPALVNVGGQLPTFQFTNLGGDVAYSTKLRAVVGDNAFILKCTSDPGGSIYLFVQNTDAAEWSCEAIQVIPVEDASGYGSLGILGIHCVNLGLLALSNKSKYARIYYDHDAPVKIKDYNLHIFEACENAIFIRWLNSNGNYSYWAFSPYPYRSVSSDKLGSVINNFSEMALANSRNLPIGYRDAFNKISVIASAVPILFRRKLMDLFTSPAVYLWNGLPSENLSESIINSTTDPYETLTTNGTIIISAINTVGSSQLMLRPQFTVKKGDVIVVILDLNLNSGAAPYIRMRIGEAGAVISNAPQLAEGFNIVTLTSTGDSDECNVIISNTPVINFSTSAIIIKRKEMERDWVLLNCVEGSHTFREKMDFDNFECTLVLPENYTQTLSGQNL